MPETLPEMTLEQRIAAALSCGTYASEKHIAALTLEVFADWYANGVPTTPPGGPVVETPSLLIATTSGSVAVGSKTVSFTTSEDFVGTIDGDSIPANVSFGFAAQSGNTLAAIAYTLSAGNIIIAKTV